MLRVSLKFYNQYKKKNRPFWVSLFAICVELRDNFPVRDGGSLENRTTINPFMNIQTFVSSDSVSFGNTEKYGQR